MFNKKLIIICLMVLANSTRMFAQLALKGAVQSSVSGLRVANVRITNLKTKSIALTNELGIFSIKASVGDTVLFTKDGYVDYRTVITSNLNLIVKLQQSIQLNEVLVKGKTKKQEMEEILADYRKKGTFYNGKPPLLSYFFKPLTALYELFGKTPKQAKRFQSYYVNELQQTEIDKKFYKELVIKWTGISNADSLENFMDKYRPPYEKVRFWSEYDAVNYIKKSYSLLKAGVK